MLDSYLPILTLIIIAVGFSFGAAILSRLVGEKKPSTVKLAPYECGMPPVGSARERFSIKFYKSFFNNRFHFTGFNEL